MDGQRIKDASDKKGGRVWIVAGILATAVIVILVGIIIYLLQSQSASQQSESAEAVPQQRNVIVAPENVEEVIAQMQEEETKTPVGSYEVTMNTHWTFPDGKSASTDAFVENSTSNTNMVYFTITLDSNGEEIYHSPYLDLGAQLSDIALDKELERGDYDAIITYHLVDDDFNELSSVSMYMIISIEN